jgi:hypothetical protein
MRGNFSQMVERMNRAKLMTGIMRGYSDFLEIKVIKGVIFLKIKEMPLT